MVRFQLLLCTYILICLAYVSSDETTNDFEIMNVTYIIDSVEANVSTSTSQPEPVTDPVQTLLDLENNMKVVLKNVFDKIFPYVSRVGVPPKASFSCLISMLNVYFGINELEPWAVKCKYF